eukprot:SAG31_NODE_10229_length_1167_cov_1.564607_1_plen_279_part_10
MDRTLQLMTASPALQYHDANADVDGVGQYLASQADLRHASSLPQHGKSLNPVQNSDPLRADSVEVPPSLRATQRSRSDVVTASTWRPSIGAHDVVASGTEAKLDLLAQQHEYAHKQTMHLAKAMRKLAKVDRVEAIEDEICAGAEATANVNSKVEDLQNNLNLLMKKMQCMDEKLNATETSSIEALVEVQLTVGHCNTQLATVTEQICAHQSQFDAQAKHVNDLHDTIETVRSYCDTTASETSVLCDMLHTNAVHQLSRQLVDMSNCVDQEIEGLKHAA